jgi:hypothetical protein
MCAAENLSIKKNPSSASADTVAIMKHVGAALGPEPTEQTMKSVFYLSRSGVGCLDGRSGEAILSAPGGDLGEFILALKVLEDVSGKNLAQFDVDTLLMNVLAAEPRSMFRACTDEDAIRRLHKMTKIGGLGPAILKNPPSSLRDNLLKLLVSPDNVGDEHLRFMLLHPSAYQVRKELTSMAIQSFYRVMWNELGVPLSSESHQLLAAKLDLAVFEGPHDEVAVVTVRSHPDCKGYSLPIPPADSNEELRLYHEEALYSLRYQIAHVIREQALALGLLEESQLDVTVEMFAQRIVSLGATLFETTVDQLAITYGSRTSLVGFPSYTIGIPKGCCPESFVRAVVKGSVEFDPAPTPKDRHEISSLCMAGSMTITTAEESAAEDKLRLDGFSIRQVGAHFQIASGAPFVFVDPREWGVSSVDSRHMDSAISVPGGSLGQFALVVAMMEHRFNTKIDVAAALTNYVLGMKANSFTYTIDVDSLYRVCGDNPACPDRTTPLEQKLAQLDSAFTHPPEGSEEQLLAALSMSTGSGVGDPFLRFVMTELGVHRPHIDGSHLGQVEKRVLKALQKVLETNPTVPELQSNWHLTSGEWATLKSVFATFKDHDDQDGSSPRLQHERVTQAIQECIHNEPDVQHMVQPSAAGPDTPKKVFESCRGVLKRMAVFVLDEDGDKSVDQHDLEVKRQKFKSVLLRTIPAFFNLLWGRPGALYKPYASGIAAKMDLVVIEGHISGHAFVKVKMAENCQKQYSPILSPFRNPQQSSVWVYHEEASKVYRSDIAAFLSSFTPTLAGKNEEVLGTAADLQDQLVHRFVSQNLFDYPVYDYTFGAGCCPLSGR